MSRFIKSFGYALTGIYHTYKTQPNFKFHCFATFAVMIAGWWFKLDHTEWLWILAAVALVLVSELFNTAIEVLVDLISPSYHAQAGIIKDTAAGAVLIASVIAAAIGLIIFIPKII